jgi:hypothetical protein
MVAGRTTSNEGTTLKMKMVSALLVLWSGTALAGEGACIRLGNSIQSMCNGAVKAEKVKNAAFFRGDFCTESGAAVYQICEDGGVDAIQKFGSGCQARSTMTKNVVMLNCKQRLDGQGILGKRRGSIAHDCAKVAFHWENYMKANPAAVCE